jgi:hypothetical protein
MDSNLRRASETIKLLREENEALTKELEASLAFYREKGRVTVETDGNLAQRFAASAEIEIGRLKAGRFTKDEIHDICHNLHGTVSAEEFAAGCRAEMIKLYGRCPLDEGYTGPMPKDLGPLRLRKDCFEVVMAPLNRDEHPDLASLMLSRSSAPIIVVPTPCEPSKDFLPSPEEITEIFSEAMKIAREDPRCEEGHENGLTWVECGKPLPCPDHPDEEGS